MRWVMRPGFRVTLWLLVMTALPGGRCYGLDRDALPTAYGAYFYSASEFKPRVLPALLSAPEAEEWGRRIQEAEWRQGPYGSDISETLLDAGNYFYGRGDYRSAIVHWRRAVHLTRVNNGLYSELQLPTLERLYRTYMDLGDFEEADGVQAYLFYLSGQHHRPGEPEHIDGLIRWVDWRRTQWLRAPTPENPAPLVSVWRMLEKQARESDEVKLTVDQLEPLVFAGLRLLYVIGTTDFGLDRQEEMLVGRQYGSAAAEPDFERTQIQALQEAAYARGRARLEELDERLAAAGLLERRARSQRELADWHLWNRHLKRATEAYAESWRLLGEAGKPELQRQWYGQPVELPAEGVLWAGGDPGADLSEGSVIVVRMDVSRNGRPRNVDAQARAAEHEGKAIRLQRLLRGTRFRPRLDNGATVATEGLVREYRLN